MNKIDGLNFLHEYKLPTVQLLELDELLNNPLLLSCGISLRLASKYDGIDVNLPSLHGIKSIDQVMDFYHKYQDDYNILIHETVRPNIIGTCSKYSLTNDVLVIETFNNFNDRKHEIVNERAIIDMLDNQIIKIDSNNFQNKRLLRDILNDVLEIPYNDFTIEFVIDREKTIYTDFYSSRYKNCHSLVKRI